MKKDLKILFSAVIILSLLGVVSFFSNYFQGIRMARREAPNIATSHYSYFSQKDFYEHAYKQAENLATFIPQEYPKAILVNHHLLAGHFIAEAFNAVATISPVTVIVISPNHFFAGKSAVITSAANWQTPFGVLEADNKLINQLTAKNLVDVEEQPFEQEHGISGIVAFIKKSLPNALVVPLILRDQMSVAKAMDLAGQITSSLPQNTLLVGSFDFSHYLTHRAANFHDISNLATVENFDYDAIPRLDTDSHSGLALFLKLLELNGRQKFHLLQHSNSAEVSRREETLETTSYVTGYFMKGASTTNSPATLLALGSVDSSATVIESLKRGSPTFSIKFLERLFIGQQTTTAFVGENNQLSATLFNYGINQQISSNKIVELGNLKIAYLYAGGQAEARAAILQGADLVIGNSKDIRLEQYRGKLIIYGLGNFLTSESLAQTTTSLALGMVYSNNQLQLYLFPIQFDKGVGKLLTAPVDGIVLKEIAKSFVTSAAIKRQIEQGVIIISGQK